MMACEVPDPHALRARADWLQRRLNLIPARYAAGTESREERDQRAKRHDYEVALLISALEGLDPPGRVTARSSEVEVKMMGITAVSTEGVLGACRNWIAKARAV